MSEQAEVTRPTATEETDPEANPPAAPEHQGASEAASGIASEQSAPAQAQAPTPEPAQEPAKAEEAPGAQGAVEPEASRPSPPDAAAEPPAVAAEAATEQAPAVEAATEAPGTPEPEETAAALAPTPVEEPVAAEAPAEDREAPEAVASAPSQQAVESAPAMPAQTSEPIETGEPPVAAEQPMTEAAAAPDATAPEGEAAAMPKPPAAKGKAAAGKKAAKPKREPPPEESTEHDLEIQELRRVKEEKIPIEGRVIGWNQGGFHVVVGTVTAFCPRSEMELKNPRSPSFYLDNTYHFQVIKHQKRGRRIVLSRKALLAEERQKLAAETRAKLVPGTDLVGRVSSITDFGAFVDLGGIDGLVHLTELSCRRVKHPREVVRVGEEVRVRVLKVEEGGERISLSMKVLEPNPWEVFAASHPPSSSFEGKVVRKTDFGLFVEVDPGLDGMVHLSQLPPGKSLSDPDFEVGTTVAGWVLKTEPERERISLSLREVPADDPWKHVSERYPEGSTIDGEVEDVASFGVFVLLEPGLTGLLPNAETGVPRGQDVSKQYPAGKRVRVQIASVDLGRRRISLALEGARISGSRTDYKEYVRQQKGQGGGLSTMAAAFAKLKENNK